MNEGDFPRHRFGVKAATTASARFVSLPYQARRDNRGYPQIDAGKRSHTGGDGLAPKPFSAALEHTIAKNKLVAEKTPGTEDLYPSARSGDRGLSLFEPAPFGVIGAITPVTNPTSTIICNTIGMLAAGNSVVFNVHPSAKNVSIFNVNLINKAILSVGGPPNLVTTVVEPTIESAQQLMKHPGIRLLYTAGEAVVHIAMHSGKRAICAGPGNPRRGR
jgi:acyl-CoA reductase-like NAD-dependent aldehyde dehydrogenase